MAQLSAYVELLPFIIPELVGYHAGQEPLLVQTIARTVRELCHRTRCLNTNSVPMRPLVIKDYRRSYVLPMPIDGVRIEALRGVKVNSIPIPLSLVRLTEGRAVSFECGSEPAELTSVCLSCGESGSDDVEDWKAVTDGSVGLTICGTEYTISGLDFSACESMTDVADTIEAAWRKASKLRDGFVRWHDDRFVIFCVSCETSWLGAGSGGTDLSGASWLNGRSGAEGAELGGMLEVDAVFVPEFTCRSLPSWFFDRYAGAVVAGTLEQLLLLPGRPWTNVERAAFWARRYIDEVGVAMKEAAFGEREGCTTWTG